MTFPALVAKGLDKKAIYNKANKLLETTGIASLADNQSSQASGGQLQRVGICRALVNDPDIIFGDEPTGALDLKSTDEIMSMLAKINEEGTTIMLVTHDVKVVARSERFLFMVDGKIVSEKGLCKYNPKRDDLQQREKNIMEWLVQNGY